MDFKNKDIASQFMMQSEKDSSIKVPGFRGMLSDVKDPVIIEAMIDRGSNLVAKRDNKPAKASGPENSTKTA